MLTWKSERTTSGVSERALKPQHGLCTSDTRLQSAPGTLRRHLIRLTRDLMGTVFRLSVTPALETIWKEAAVLTNDGGVLVIVADYDWRLTVCGHDYPLGDSGLA